MAGPGKEGALPGFVRMDRGRVKAARRTGDERGSPAC